MTFVDNGVHTLDDVADLSDQDLQDLGEMHSAVCLSVVSFDFVACDAAQIRSCNNVFT